LEDLLFIAIGTNATVGGELESRGSTNVDAGDNFLELSLQKIIQSHSVFMSWRVANRQIGENSGVHAKSDKIELIEELY
jgi:hypothetical protein